MCRYKDKIPDNCTDYQKIELTLENKTDIVDIHNNLRNFVASGGYINETDTHFPEAAAMNYLRWSDELASIAQRWADQCLPNENQDECRDTEEFAVGQNVVVVEISSRENIPNFPDLFMTKWSNSFHYFNLNDIVEFNASKIDEIGQYSQLIWDTTEYIGCALITFKSPFVEKTSTVHIVRMVCNYGPSGNLQDTPIYKVGQPCSLCVSKQCHERFHSLCIMNLKAQLAVERSKINEDVRRIMMEKYSMFQNGDDCFCEDIFDLDSGSEYKSRMIPDITIFIILLNFRYCSRIFRLIFNLFLSEND
ncbi:hypothetical protein HHI36_007084 [Cryptolaemus montrouzieri]|uniref:SCP domain-containing protein n=1 Tax=Cryptolaemus montrouzieri TaxID=559131 RepID=A0ABD2MNM6_9CUCU